MNISEHPYLARIVAAARAAGPRRIAVVYPCERVSIEAALHIAELGIADVTLVGPSHRIAMQAKNASLDIARCVVMDTPDDPVAATEAAIAMVRAGSVDILMKGSLHTDELLGVVVRRESGLRGPRRLSHVFLFDVPGRPKPLILTDCVVNIEPDLTAKRDIAQNAIDFAHTLGILTPRLAILSSSESVNPASRSSLDAAALSKMAERGQIPGALVDGPLAFDNAVSAHAAQVKGIRSTVAGEADVLLVPNLDTGNALYKCLVYMSTAECAGLVLGSRVPVILTSRSDSSLARVSSAALAGVLDRPSELGASNR